MSKKTVVIKMPVRATPSPEDERARTSRAAEERTSPIAQFADHAGETAGPSKPDQWVRRRDAGAASAPGAARSVTIDLAAERDLLQAAALAFLVPPALGWFWLSNAMNRAWGQFG